MAYINYLDNCFGPNKCFDLLPVTIKPETIQMICGKKKKRKRKEQRKNWKVCISAKRENYSGEIKSPTYFHEATGVATTSYLGCLDFGCILKNLDNSWTPNSSREAIK